MFCGRYGGQSWEELERLPLSKLRRRAAALCIRLAEEAPTPTPTGH